MAETEEKVDNQPIADGAEEDEGHDESGHVGNLSNPKSTYRQKYKPAWELDTELREWLTACATDTYAAYCRYCRTKLHAHKKGLLAHAKSAKHKKHVSNPICTPDAMAYMPVDPYDNPLARSNGDVEMSIEIADDGDRAPKRNLRGDRLFKDEWLKDQLFSAWVRKVPRNNTRALCIACRCLIKAGRSELVTHTKAAKHKKAMLEGQPFEEISEAELNRLEMSISNDPNTSMAVQPQVATQQVAFRPSVIDLPGMFVDEILRRLDDHVPLNLAEKWDNVGVITKPSQPVKVYSILLTIDLNEKIVEEAIKKRVQFIISYHPPIFTGVKSLNTSRWKDKAIIMCIEHRITVYSPHTALDAIKGGINDWLISAFITGDGNNVRPIKHSMSQAHTACLEVLLQETQDTVAQAFKDVNNFTMTAYDNASTDVRVSCSEKSLPDVVEQLDQNKFTQLCSRVVKLDSIPMAGVGMGRVVVFGSPLPLYEVVQRTKTHLDLTYIRLALSLKHTRDTKVSSIAVCAGSGASVLKGCEADIWITGEMSHHEVLDAVNTGVTVILCEHSNTERGFLRDWSQQLRTVVFEDQVFVSHSELDKDPLRIV